MSKTIALAIALVALAASGAAAAAAEANFGIQPPPPSGVDKEGSWYVGENLKVGDKEGSWYVGENLKVGDYFSYDLCHVRYGNCTEFNMKIWFKERAQTRDETWWLADVVVTDGDRIVVGEMSFDGRGLAHVGTDQELREYGEAFNLSVLFLSYLVQFGSDSEGEKGKKFTDTWLAMIGELCGLRVAPSGLEDVTVPAGTWEDAVVVSWIGCDNGKTWIADEFPFPLKADAYRATSEGQLRSFAFVLVDYDNVQESPFAWIVSTSETERIGCGADIKRVVPVEKATDGFKYVVHVSYGPDEAVEGCEMEWLLKFKGKEAVPELLDRVQFDILVLGDDYGGVVRSVASEHGNRFLYAPSGLYLLQFDVKEPPGIAEYTVVVYGLAPEWVLPRPDEQDALTVLIDVRPKDGAAGGVADDPARAETEKNRSPRLQVLDGIPADEVVCSYGRILMTSPSGAPACVFETSGDMLERRGL